MASLYNQQCVSTNPNNGPLVCFVNSLFTYLVGRRGVQTEFLKPVHQAMLSAQFKV